MTKTSEKHRERVWTLDEVAPLLGMAYRAWKEEEGNKNQYKGIFYGLADKAISNDQAAVQVEVIAAPTHEKALERAQLHNPGWLIRRSRNHPELPGVFEVVLEEDPSLQPFSFEHEGVKYARSITRGPVLIDDEWLKEENLVLYERVTYKLPWGERIAVPIEHLDAKLVGALGRYIYNGKPKAKLEPPREVKDD